MKKFILALSLLISATFIGETAEAATTHTVKSGESLWKISMNYGVTVDSIKKVNNRYHNEIYPGEHLKVPKALTAYEKDLLARLVTAEAKGEPYAGQVAVAVVVLNRVDSNLFPNTVHGVIHEVSNGHHAFSPVKNGMINQPATASAKKAVEEAIAFRGQGNGSLFFYNPATATNNWNATRQKTVTIGNHVFSK
ncbi:cell wall hydrolase [Anaerobacillus sp. MEB173]|uniref:cell wall hydrolase n=1 Tax=Anaerobacillus sp. MEB173 TaxID=3383345 RepID=UPI003F93BB8F